MENFLIIQKGISNSLVVKSGILKSDTIFTNSLSSVKAKNIDILYNILALFHSTLFKYYTIETASSVGIEREQSLNIEKFKTPYIQNNKIINLTKKIEHLMENNILKKNNYFNILKNKLDITILQSFDLTSQEYALIDYATNIIIPWVMQKKYELAFKPYKYDNKEDRKKLEEYVNPNPEIAIYSY